MTTSLERPPDEAQRAALDLLRASQRILLTGHERPDGDCIGAQAALSRVLEAMGKTVWILNPGPPEPQFDYLARACRYGAYDGADLPVHDLVVMLDGSELSRTGALAPALSSADSKKLVIDHHIHVGDAWWDAAFVDRTASATGLLVHRVARALDVELDEVACLGVFTSIVTDTGWFKYSNTDAETLAVAGELVAGGVRPADVFGSIYQRRSRSYPLLVGAALASLHYEAEGRLALVSLRTQTDPDGALETDDVLDLVRSVAKVEVVLLLREVSAQVTKLSARSKTGFDVSALARQFGGGGHAKAAGATLELGFDAARDALLAAALAGLED